MEWRLSGISVMALLLAGCGGSNDQAPAEATGVLQVGGAAGVRYSSATRSGSTDAGGQFKYLPGETVTFSIGAIELGSVPGAARVTAFTLAGGTPPTTEIALRRELDRARRGSTPFVRAANIHWLLLALDADHDPANGIDVRDAATRLGAATIDLGLPLRAFGSQVMRLAPNLTVNIPPSRPIVHAYQSIGVHVAVHAATDSRTTPDFFPLVTNAPVTNNFTRYNADGSRASQGSDLDGTYEIEYSWTYDALGRTRKNSLHTSPTISLFSSSHDGEYQYDARGAIAGIIDHFDNFSDGEIDFTNRHVVENDAYGFPLLDTTEQVQGEDGALMSRTFDHSSYDSRHIQVGAAYDTDSNGDGTIDSRWSYSAPVDAQGRPGDSVTESDDNADGVVDSRSTQKTKDGSEGTNVTVNEVDDNADGVIDTRYVTTAHYERGGWLTWQVYESDFDNDGVIDGRQRIDLDYDLEHRTVSEKQSADFDGDGVIDTLTTRVTTFDSTGNVLSTTFTDDYSQDGVIDYQTVESHQYGLNGELLGGDSRTLPTTPFGSPVSLSIPLNSTTVTTNERVADGVLLLAQEYLEPNYAGYVSAAF